jgi:DNA-binding transcriptional LysR family regulator
MDDKRLALRAVRFLRQALLSTAPSVLSCAVSRLEARLGWRLLQRTTLRMDLTDAGRLYLEQVRTAFGLLDDAERDVQRQAGALAGRVRLSVPTAYGHHRRALPSSTHRCTWN